VKRLHILDGHGYIFRAHFGLMTAGKGDRKEIRLSNSEGMPTGALYVFSRMLLRMAADREPSHIAVVFDAGRKSFRTEMYPEYKAHRPPTPEDLQIQMPYFRRIVEAMGWPVLSIAGVEADDVIATLVTTAGLEQIPTTILSADKDLMQLVDDRVEMYDSLSQRTYHRSEVIEKFGVPPERIADYLALTGDASDNIPGLEGVGDKTAAKLLAEHTSLDALIAANPTVPRLKNKQPFSDATQLQRLAISRELVKLKRDVDVGIALSALAVKPPDQEALLAVLTELEFTVLLDKFNGGSAGTESASATKPVRTQIAQVANTSDAGVAAPDGAHRQRVTAKPRMAKVMPGATAHAQGSFAFEGTQANPDGAKVAATVVANVVELDALIQKVRAIGSCGLLATFDGQRDDRTLPLGIAIATDDSAAYYVPLQAGDWEPAKHAGLAAMLCDGTIGKRCFDAKRVGKALARCGLPMEGVVDDAMIAAFIADPTQALAGHPGQDAQSALSALASAGHRGATSAAALDARTVAQTLAPAVCSIAASMTQLTSRMSPDAARLYRDLELPISNLLTRVEANGICIDAGYFSQLSTEVNAQIAALEASIHTLAGEPFNVGSPKQLGHILFEKLHLLAGRMKKTKTGFSTDADVLESMIEEHPIVRLVLDYRELTKLAGTYLDALPPLVNPATGRLHTTFNMVAATTGRLSSQDPNLQNIPIRSELGRKIRRGFVAAPGHLLVAADYSQIELRILAHLSGDAVLLRAFRDRVDVHTQTACEVFGIAAADVTAHHRRVAKAVNYGLIYGQSDFGLARALDIPRREAAEYSARYFERFPSIRKYLADVVVKARADGGTTTLLGRWRPIPELSSKTQVVKRAAERVAQNTPMQGAGADIMKLAMLHSERALQTAGMKATMLLTVHDELVFEARTDVAEAAGKVIAEAMSKVIELSVPLDVDVGIAPNWADA
jgi:DNA polymerase I